MTNVRNATTCAKNPFVFYILIYSFPFGLYSPQQKHDNKACHTDTELYSKGFPHLICLLYMWKWIRGMKCKHRGLSLCRWTLCVHLGNGVVLCPAFYRRAHVVRNHLQNVHPKATCVSLHWHNLYSHQQN